MPTPAALVAACCTLCLPAVAQFPTVPATLAGVEGGSGSSIPFGLGQAVRYMCIYDAEELPWTGPRVIQAIALRADNTLDNSTTFAQVQFVDLSVAISTSSVRAENASATFDDNHGADRVLVIAQAHIVLPAQPPMAGPRPANIVLQFAQPWIYGMTPVRNGEPAPSSLVVDLMIRNQPSGVTYRIDNLGGCSSQITPFGNHDPALCQTSASQPLVLSGDASMLGGTNYTWRVSGMAQSALFGIILNASNRGSFFGQPVPVPLFDPLNPTLPNAALGLPFAAPGCWVNLPILSVLIGAGNQAGTGTVSIGLPAGRRFVGESVFAQAVVYDLSANPLLFVTSAGQRSTMCGPLAVARIYSTGAAPTTGQVSLGQGAVIEVR